MKKNRWRKPIDLVANGGRANVWAYVSKSGKTVEVYFRPLNPLDGTPLLRSAISTKISVPRIQRWVGQI